MSVTVTKKKQQAPAHAPAKERATGKVAYIVSRFPKLTETFVLYEVLEMEKRGVTIEIYPLLRHNESVIQPEAKRLIERAHYTPFLSLPILKAHWHFIRRAPLVYFMALFEALKGTLGSANYFVGALAYFPKAVRFAYEVEQMGIKHIHAQFANHPALVALIMHRLTGIPFSFTGQGSDIHVDRTMLKTKLAAAEFMFTVSSYNKDVIVKECGQPMRDKVHILYGGIDTERFKPSGHEDVDGPFQILCVSRFEPVKGFAQLVEACRLLHERGVDFECHLVGDGELRTQIEEQIVQSGLSGKVISHGARTQAEVIDRLAHSSVLALATIFSPDGKREGIPNVLKEAMSCGLPVVASNVSGIPELVEHEKSGLLVPPNEPAAIADALERLKADPALRRRLGQAGRAKVLSQFDLQNSTSTRVRLFLQQPARKK